MTHQNRVFHLLIAVITMKDEQYFEAIGVLKELKLISMEYLF
jgi:hypothetical protein